MAVERAKVLSAIEAKLKGKSLSKNFKENLASKWAEKIETDDNIEDYINDREDILIEASSEADRRATEAAAKAKGDKKDPDNTTVDTTTTTAATTTQDDAPEWAKALIESNKSLQERLQSIEGEKQQTTIQSKVKELLGADVPELWLKGKPLPAKMEEVEAWVTAEKQAYTDFKQEHINNSIGGNRPQFGNKPVSKETEVSAEMKQYIADREPAKT